MDLKIIQQSCQIAKVSHKQLLADLIQKANISLGLRRCWATFAWWRMAVRIRISPLGKLDLKTISAVSGV